MAAPGEAATRLVPVGRVGKPPWRRGGVPKRPTEKETPEPALANADRLGLGIETCLPLHGQAVERLQEGLGAGLDDVSADGLAALHPAVVLQLDAGLALGVLAHGHPAHLVVAR